MLAAGDQHVEFADCILQRLDLAQAAAGVRVELPELGIGIPIGQRRCRGLDRPKTGQAEPALDQIAIGERLGEMMPGIEEDDRDIALDAGGERQQQRRFRAEGRDDRDPSGKFVFDDGAQEFFAVDALVLTIERGRPLPCLEIQIHRARLPRPLSIHRGVSQGVPL